MFIHSFHPNAILLQIGPVRIYWYGFFIVVGIIIAFLISHFLLLKYKAKGEKNEDKNYRIDLVDLAVYLLIGGLAGARLAHIVAELRYYISRPLDIFKIWNGGLWIYGAILGGIVGLIVYVKRRNRRRFIDNFSSEQNNKTGLLVSDEIKFILDILSPGLIFAQAIGRWGNYFNQELYGLPTNLSWGIPVDILHRVPGFVENQFFHPVFLYESVWCVVVGVILLIMHKIRLRNIINNYTKKIKLGSIFLWYLFLYSFGRFVFEFLRVDSVPMVFGVRITQITAGIAVVVAGVLVIKLFNGNLGEND